ncbi:MurR/RpiR family transcriptional regulator (plasmid) [Arthrobacter sp. FW306-05-C]|uniref:MurR/RpiR family transcriptional regulator n=1 Tax=Arthrobacter sp. FW306-05-C TaxID=2879620 RepID=UPI001F16EA95|nr:MurR/RpiR family transcriptional regulator [Arthrobacter sp. FW306-05-C]UKA69007.1 MurR/RpiR family transcriptional regulator [Arthrobacter sp. FW306-05-C]
MNPYKAEPPVGGSRAHIMSIFPSLVPSEQRVAQFCLDSPETVATMSVADLVAVTATSPATVVRACKRLGFDGFQHLRQVLLRDLGAAARDNAELEGWAATGTPGTSEHLVSGIFSRAAHDIRSALASLDFEAFAAAADAIRSANRLLVVANGASVAPAKSFALRCLSTGVVCEAPGDIVSQHITAKLLSQGDVCIAVSDSGLNGFTLGGARIALERGATVIGVTSYARSALSELSTHSLVAGAEFHHWQDQLPIGNIVQMLILSALHAAVTGNSPEVDQARSAVFEEVLHIVGEEPE